ncbi:hypothetical protein KP509_23G015600 [Ceratopteris richardii]|uniref:DUF868 domain-containing protein n=1 Tax=Ceratopteris richardii TaxID=49495 RepID=A0A8T2RZB0_CERRI|nr:hypothetical protein KP509_23G015600 [Ceratopteris richardii]
MFNASISKPSGLPSPRGSRQQHVVVCSYETKLAGVCRHVFVTWLQSASSYGLCVTIEDRPSRHCTCKVQISPWTFWKRKGVKSLDIGGNKVKIFWDLSSATYLCGAEPREGFYVAVVCDEEVILLLGDKKMEALKKSRSKPSTIDAILLSRREHVFGRNVFRVRAPLGDSGKVHDIRIECETRESRKPYLRIDIDAHPVVCVGTDLRWKFRGNHVSLLRGAAFHVLWDIHGWLFGDGTSSAVFIFCECGAPDHHDSMNESIGIRGLSAQMPENSKRDDLYAAMKWSRELNMSVADMKVSKCSNLRASGQMNSGYGDTSLVLSAWRCA